MIFFTQVEKYTYNILNKLLNNNFNMQLTFNEIKYSINGYEAIQEMFADVQFPSSVKQSEIVKKINNEPEFVKKLVDKGIMVEVEDQNNPEFCDDQHDKITIQIAPQFVNGMEPYIVYNSPPPFLVDTLCKSKNKETKEESVNRGKYIDINNRDRESIENKEGFWISYVSGDAYKIYPKIKRPTGEEILDYIEKYQI